MRPTLIILITCMCYLGGCKSKLTNKLSEIELQLSDSISIIKCEKFIKGSKTVLIYFNTDCDHCQNETNNIIQRIHDFGDNKLIFVTIDPLERMRVFVKHFKTDNYNNILVGKDHSYQFFNTYKPNRTPSIYIYDQRGDLVVVYNGEPKVSDIITILNKI